MTACAPRWSGCTHEHACIRCDFLALHPDAIQRLDTIGVDLQQRIETAKDQNWLGDVEQLSITVRRLEANRAQLTPAKLPVLDEGIAALPAWDVPRVGVLGELEP